MESLTTKMNALRIMRAGLTQMRAAYKSKLADFEESEKDAMIDIEVLTEDIKNNETEIREMACALYANNPSVKKFESGVAIRVNKTLLYDPSKALEWAKEHGMCLALDKKEFESVAKATEIDFVAVEDKVTPTIPKK